MTTTAAERERKAAERRKRDRLRKQLARARERAEKRAVFAALQPKLKFPKGAK